MLAAHEYRGEPLSAELYPERLRIAFGDARAPAIAQRYPVASFASPAAALAAVVGDGLLSCPTIEGAALLARSRPAWVYRFTTREVPYVLGAPALLAPGAFHSAEIPLVFGVPERDRFTPALDELSAVMRRAWTNFARGGDPNGAGAPSWPAFQEGEESYLLLDSQPQPAMRPLGDACAFWRTLGLDGPL